MSISHRLLCANLLRPFDSLLQQGFFLFFVIDVQLFATLLERNSQ